MSFTRRKKLQRSEMDMQVVIRWLIVEENALLRSR